jgi:hypothetical protein
MQKIQRKNVVERGRETGHMYESTSWLMLNALEFQRANIILERMGYKGEIENHLIFDFGFSIGKNKCIDHSRTPFN